MSIDFSTLRTDSTAGRILRTFLRLLPRDMVVPILQGPLRGARWIVGSSTHGCWLGSYELSKQHALAREIRPGDLIVDAGANVGFYTLLGARLAGPSGRVVAFEPVPRNLGYLRRHVKLNRAQNVTIEACALWSAPGVVTFDESHDALQGRIAPSGQLEVRAEVLDSYLTAWGRPPDVIKIDIEGGEVDALRGGLKMLRAGVRALFVESFGEDLPACRSLLEREGYAVEPLVAGTPWDMVSEVVARPENAASKK